VSIERDGEGASVSVRGEEERNIKRGREKERERESGSKRGRERASERERNRGWEREREGGKGGEMCGRRKSDILIKQQIEPDKEFSILKTSRSCKDRIDCRSTYLRFFNYKSDFDALRMEEVTYGRSQRSLSSGQGS
jgi:hypothetical protein